VRRIWDISIIKNYFDTLLITKFNEMSGNNSLTSANIKCWSHPPVIYMCHLDFASRIYMRIIRLSSTPLVAFVVPTTRFRFRPARATTDRPSPPELARTLAETSVTPRHVNRYASREISLAISLTGSLAVQRRSDVRRKVNE